MEKLLHKWLAALIKQAKDARKPSLLSYTLIYATRRPRRLRSMAIERFIAEQLRLNEERRRHPYIWRNDFFFDYAGDKAFKTAFQRRPRKRVNTYQIRRWLSETGIKLD